MRFFQCEKTNQRKPAMRTTSTARWKRWKISLKRGSVFHCCAELHADVGERVAPGPGTDEGVDVEAKLVHLRDAGGKGDEGANDGEHAADQHGDGAVAVEEVIDEVEIAAAEEDVAAVALDHGASAACADPVGGDGAEVGGEGCDGCEEDEVELRVGESVAGERHDDFRRDGNAGGLDRHEQDDAGVASAGDRPTRREMIFSDMLVQYTG